MPYLRQHRTLLFSCLHPSTKRRHSIYPFYSKLLQDVTCFIFYAFICNGNHIIVLLFFVQSSLRLLIFFCHPIVSTQQIVYCACTCVKYLYNFFLSTSFVYFQYDPVAHCSTFIAHPTKQANILFFFLRQKHG